MLEFRSQLENEKNQQERLKIIQQMSKIGKKLNKAKELIDEMDNDIDIGGSQIEFTGLEMTRNQQKSYFESLSKLNHLLTSNINNQSNINKCLNEVKKLKYYYL